MKKLWTLLIFLMAVLIATGVKASWEDKLSNIGFKQAPEDYIYGPELSAAPGTPDIGWRVYVVSDVPYFVSDGQAAISMIAGSTPAFDDIANPDADKTITFDNDEIATFSFADINEDMFTVKGVGAFGDVSVVKIEQSTGNATDGTVLEVVSADANVDPLVVSSSAQAGVLTVGQGGTVSIVGATDITGDVTVTGSLTQTGTFYQSALAAAASGNTNLTIDAAGTGTITIGGTSTGNTVFPQNVVHQGNVDVGNAATDTLTITSIIDDDVTLDDATTDSPALILKDATDETGSFVKVDGDNVQLTTTATEGFEVVTGNLVVGNGTPGTAAMDGEDFYVNGDSEFDGAIQADGAVTCASTLSVTGTTALSENVTFTMAADEYLKLDGDTTDQTQTAGALDIDVGTATNTVSAVNSKLTYTTGGVSEAAYNVKLDIDDDTSSAGYLYGLYVDSSDATGSSEVIGLYTGTTLDTGVKQLVAAGGTAITTDANTTDSTLTSGIWLLNIGTVTNGNLGQLIDYNVGDTGAGVTASALKIDLDDDTSANAATINGFWAYSGDLTGHATTAVRGFYTSGCDVALQADNGYVRIGTGSTPGVTPSDDDLYVEGTTEIDGILYPDGGITGDGQADIVGMTRKHESYTGAGNTITIAESGSVFDNTGDADGSLHTLPEASTAVGCFYTFVVTAAQNIVVELDDADQFLHLTLDAGDQIQSATIGDSITVMALDATNWAVLSAYPASTDWADGGA